MLQQTDNDGTLLTPVGLAGDGFWDLKEQASKRHWELVEEVMQQRHVVVTGRFGHASSPYALFGVIIIITSSATLGRPIARDRPATWRNSRDRRGLSQPVVSCSEWRERGAAGPAAENESQSVLVFTDDPLDPKAETVRNT